MDAKTIHKLADGSPNERALAAIEIRHAMAAKDEQQVAANQMSTAMKSAELPAGIARILDRLQGVDSGKPEKSVGIRATGRALETSTGQVENMVLTAPRRKRVANAALIKGTGETTEDVMLRGLGIGMFDPSTKVRVCCAHTSWRATGDSEVAIPILVDALENAEDEDGRVLAAYALEEVDASKVSHLVGDDEVPQEPASASPVQESMTVIIHGTFARNSEWYQPGGSFHSYIKENVYPDVYSGSDFYSWSGRYSIFDNQLERIWKRAAERLVAWVKKHPANTIRLMGHSHGNNVINMATRLGLPRTCTLIQMSPGVRKSNLPDMDASRVSSQRLFNFYASKDLVLLADGSRVTYAKTAIKDFETKKKVSTFNHSRSHTPKAWEKHDLAQRIDVCRP